MSILKPDESVGFYAGAAVAIIVFAALIVWFQAWLLGVVLGWFGVKLALWQCAVIVLLIGSLFGASRSSN
jgi:hypothetical protein